MSEQEKERERERERERGRERERERERERKRERDRENLQPETGREVQTLTLRIREMKSGHEIKKKHKRIEKE